jgi:type I restriction-modification system DNA methylase subunit
MKRIDIVDIIGRKFHESNIENGEWSYPKALNRPIKGHIFLDLRFVKDNVSVLVETKQTFTSKDERQLFDYIKLEKELTHNNVIGILANTKGNKIKVWENENPLDDTTLKSMSEYIAMFDVSKINDKEQVMQSTYKLNETLHRNDIPESLRSQFVGTCLLALDDKKFVYTGLQTEQIIAGMEKILKGSLVKNGSTQKELKLEILCNNVLKNQKVENLSPKDFEQILNFIKNEIYPFIDEKTNKGQDLLNLFFTTFNKYVGKEDKNQAYTPDHIVHFMCTVAKIDRNSRVLDPTCGSGAFLVQAMTQALKSCRTNAEKSNVKRKQIFGIEEEKQAFGLAVTNMLIHSDGNSNIIKANCFSESKWIKKSKINTVLMNPPYNAKPVNIPKSISEYWKKNIKEDPTKGFCFVNYTAAQVKNGTLLCLLPLSCAIGSSKEIEEEKRKILENNTLEAVFTLPPDMFHPGASANACCMVFTLNKPHPKEHETFFGYYKDDGLVKKKNIGRVDTKDKWDTIEKEWLDLYNKKTVKAGLSALKIVTYTDEWLCEAYMETDYSKLKQTNFEKSIRDYLSYLVLTAQTDLENQFNNKLKTKNLDIKKWKKFKVGGLFKIENCKCGNAGELDEGTDVFYIGAKKDENGIMKQVTYDCNLISKGNGIIFICDGQGSVGYSNYINKDFIGSTTLSVGYNDKLNKYIGLFIVSVLDLERPKYSYGRKYRKFLSDTFIKLPANKTEPDWEYMEDYIKSLPLSKKI